jgi:hypothetical protein
MFVHHSNGQLITILRPTTALSRIVPCNAVVAIDSRPLGIALPLGDYSLVILRTTS